MWSPIVTSLCMSSFVWTTHLATNGSTARFHFRTFIPSYPFQHVFQWDIWSSSCSNFIMFWPKGECLAYSSTNFPKLLTKLPDLFHNASHTTWTTPSINYKYLSMRVHTSHRPYGYPPLMATNTQKPIMQFATPLLSLHRILVSMWVENNYTCFLQTHSTPTINESTLCSPKMAFAP